MADKKPDKNPAVQRFGDERKKALEMALSKIEKDFGKGSVMKLGDAAESSKSTDRNLPVRPPSHCTPSPKHRRWAALPRSSTPSMHLIPCMPAHWA